MREVLVIREECHGVIGVAEDVVSAMKCLKEERWFEIFDEELYAEYGKNWEELERNVNTVEKFNECFDGNFHLQKFKLFELKG